MEQPELYEDQDLGREPSITEMLAARAAALEILEEVLSRKNPLDTVLDRAKGFKELPQRDRAFCRMLVATTLRRLGQIDDLIVKASEDPSSTHASLQHILRLGVAQLMFMNVPDHAAVDTSVRLAEGSGMERRKGFVNGVLRNLSRVGREWLARQDEARLNTPEWLLKIWITDYGFRTAAEIATANLAEAPLDITIRDEASRNHWGAQLKASEIACGTLRLPPGSGAVQNLPGFDEGAWWVQDVAAAMPANLFGNIEGQHVVDLCAAPGGKTMQLAAQGAHVRALDRSVQRLERLKENIARVGFADRVEVIAADAGHWNPGEQLPFILLDAPCTATGTIRRNPDVAHHKSLRDLESLVDVQAHLLENAFNILMPGGVLIYCTCSLQKAEGEEQIAGLLARHPEAMKIAIRAEEIGGLEECITEEGDVRVLPFHQAASGGMDGFFISRLTKAG